MARLPDLSNTSQFPVFPAGVYTFKILSAEQGTSQAGFEKLATRLEVHDGPDGSGENRGGTLLTSYSLQKQAQWRLQGLCAAVGLDTKQGLDDQMLVGQYFRATVTVEQYKGKDTNRVSNETAIARGPAAPVAAPQQPSMLQQPPAYVPPPPVYAPQQAPVYAPPQAPVYAPPAYVPPPPAPPPPAAR